jgi:hypothetical protein
VKACRITVFASTLAAIVVTALLLSGCATSHQALAQTSDTLDGWGQFKFGMTVEQVRAMNPPASAWKYNPNLGTKGASSLESAGPVKEFGSEFGFVTLIFEPGLDSIEFRINKNVSAEACEESFGKFLSAAEAQYGNFGPDGNSHGALIRGISGAKSQYLYFKSPPYFFGTLTSMNAIGIVGKRSIRLTASHVIGPKDEDCFMTVWLMNRAPNPALSSPRPTQ